MVLESYESFIRYSNLLFGTRIFYSKKYSNLGTIGFESGFESWIRILASNLSRFESLDRGFEYAKRSGPWYQKLRSGPDPVRTSSKNPASTWDPSADRSQSA